MVMMGISSGGLGKMANLTIGIGGDFPELTAAITFLVGLGALTEDYTFTDISGYVVVGTELGLIGPMNGHTVIFTSDNPAYGNPNAGHIIVMNQWCYIIVRQGIQPAHNGTLIFEHKNIRSAWEPGVLSYLLTIRPNAAFGGQILTIIIDNIIIICPDSFAARRLAHYDIHQANDQPNTTIIFTNSKHSGGRSLHSIPVLRIDLARLVIENIVVDRMQIGIDLTPPVPSLQRITYRNVISMRTDDGAPQDDWEVNDNPSDLVIENCADADGTLDRGTNNQLNIDPAVEFQSLDINDDNYLSLARGTNGGDIELLPGAPQLGVNGIAPTYAGDTDIEGNARPGIDGRYSIGPTEQQYDSVPYVYTNSEYTNRNLILWLFLGDATAIPRYGSVPLEVDFTPGGPYDAIIEVSTAFDYIIIEVNESDYIIEEGPLA